MKERLLKKIRKDLEVFSKLELAKKLGIPYANLWRILNGGNATMKNWEKIDAYYRLKH